MLGALGVKNMKTKRCLQFRLERCIRKSQRGRLRHRVGGTFYGFLSQCRHHFPLFTATFHFSMLLQCCFCCDVLSRLTCLTRQPSKTRTPAHRLPRDPASKGETLAKPKGRAPTARAGNGDDDQPLPRRTKTKRTSATREKVGARPTEGLGRCQARRR